MSSDSDSDEEKKQVVNKVKVDKKQKKEKGEKRKKVKDSGSSSDEGVNDPMPAKKAKSSAGTQIINIGGVDLIELGRLKYASINKFGGKKFINIREYYNEASSGQLKPGKKGIALSLEQFKVLKACMDELEAMYAKE